MFVVFDAAYALPGVYRNSEALKKRLKPGVRFPPVRADSRWVLPVDNEIVAADAYALRFPGRGTASLYW